MSYDYFVISFETWEYNTCKSLDEAKNWYSKEMLCGDNDSYDLSVISLGMIVNTETNEVWRPRWDVTAIKEEYECHYTKGRVCDGEEDDCPCFKNHPHEDICPESNAWPWGIDECVGEIVWNYCDAVNKGNDNG